MAWNPNIPTVTNRVQDDLNAIRENFQHLDPLAQVVGELAPYVQALLDSRIVEMGSNSNGEYVRWENGLQVCWRQEIVGAVQDFPSTFNLLDDRPFPAVFAELIGIQATVGVLSDAASTRGAFYIASVGEALDRWSRLCIVRHANASGTNQRVYVSLLAIGRWK